MSKARIFLSSTCYDLRAVREHLCEKMAELGHEFLASEYSSFPINPGLSTTENCKKVVRDHADLFVLIVGGKRGSLEPSGNRSVVNAEYIEARARGLDSFIFVDKGVWDLLPIYQKNPNTDFSPTVDHPEVFKFIAELRTEARWIHTFTKTDDIIATLRTQLSGFLKMLIERGRAGSLIVPREFASDSRQIISLIQERPPFWEHLLTVELLDRAVNDGKRRLKNLNDGLTYRPAEFIRADEAMDRIQKLFADITNIATTVALAVKEITPSWGPQGVAGNPIEIREACERIAELINASVNWEMELKFLRAPDDFMPLFSSLRGSTSELIQELARVGPELRSGLELAKSGPGPHSILINLDIKSPSSLVRFMEELEKLKRKLGIA